MVVFSQAHLAHPDVLSLLRQILEEGELHDSMGKKADFRNCVVVLTVPPMEQSISHHQRDTTNTENLSASSDLHNTSTSRVASIDDSDPMAANNKNGTIPSVSLSSSINPSSHRQDGTQHNARALDLSALDQSGHHLRQSGAALRSGAHHRAAVPTVFLPPEIVAAMDAVVPFKNMTPEGLKEVARKIVDEALPALAAQGVMLKIEDGALVAAAEVALRSSSGAAGLGATVRARILAPAVDYALREMSGNAGFVGKAVVVDGNATGEVTIKNEIPGPHP